VSLDPCACYAARGPAERIHANIAKHRWNRDRAPRDRGRAAAAHAAHGLARPARTDRDARETAPVGRLGGVSVCLRLAD